VQSLPLVRPVIFFLEDFIVLFASLCRADRLLVFFLFGGLVSVSDSGNEEILLVDRHGLLNVDAATNFPGRGSFLSKSVSQFKTQGTV